MARPTDRRHSPRDSGPERLADALSTANGKQALANAVATITDLAVASHEA